MIDAIHWRTGPDTTSPIYGRKRILCVDDHAISQRFVGGMLANLGLCVDVVVDGAAALEAAARTDYGAILMDCQSSLVDVDDVTTAIRRLQGASRHTPIIGVTTATAESDRERSLASGMDDWLTKPFNLRALNAVLGRWTPTLQTPVCSSRSPDPRSPGSTPSNSWTILTRAVPVPSPS